MSEKPLFLAGASGMVGRALMRYLSEHSPDKKIRAACFSQQNPFAENAQVESVQGDLRLLEDCQKMCKGCGTAILAAASTGGAAQAAKEPWRQVNDNIIMNAQLLEALSKEGIKRAVFIGSATAYQDFEGEIREEELNWNQDPHFRHFGVGWVMRSLEKLCQFWHQTTGIEIIMVRAANVYGPFAKFDPAHSNFIPALVRKSVDKVDPFEVWGSAEVTRDVIFADDFAEAIVKLLQSDVKFDVFNIGSGSAVKVGDALNLCLKYSDHKPSDIIYRSDGPVTVKNRVLNCDKVKKIIEWSPRHSLDAGIQKTVEWWKQNKETWKR